MGMIYLPGVVIVGYYFDKKRALANGIATSGTGVGTLAFPPLMSWLIENYGWRQGSFILAGIGIHYKAAKARWLCDKRDDNTLN